VRFYADVEDNEAEALEEAEDELKLAELELTTNANEKITLLLERDELAKKLSASIGRCGFLESLISSLHKDALIAGSSACHTKRDDGECV